MKITVTSAIGEEITDIIVPVSGNGVAHKTLQLLEPLTGVAATNLELGFKGEVGEVQLIYHQNRKIYLLGLGEKQEFHIVLKAFRLLSVKWKSKLPAALSVCWLYENIHHSLEGDAEAAANGLFLGRYEYGMHKSDKGDLHPLTSEDAALTLIVPEDGMQAAEKAANRGVQIAHAQMDMMKLVNSPSNHKNPVDLANWALNSGKNHGFKVTVFDKKAIEEAGFHGLLAVNRGSEFPAKFIVMEYEPEGDHKDLPKVGLVGKGVTFDTGGVSLKPSTNMHYMKSDMGGAAAVFGTMEATARLQLPVHLIGIVPATDNSIGTTAIKPSDVIQSYSGITIEIIDTDAEGRLILADGLHYMVKEFQPDILIDLATLTGSVVRTFGYNAAGLFSNEDSLAHDLTKAADKTGERVWRLPIWDVYKDDLKSEIADIKNYSGRPICGAIDAAKFLECFIDDHPKWAHLDIAGVAFGDTEYSSQKSATAFGVRLLTEFLDSL